MKRTVWHWLAAASLGLFTVSTASAQFVLFPSDQKPAARPAENKFVHPVTSPYFHEDSFVNTDVRAWFVYHDFPNGGVIDGGSAKVYALQVRVAITDQLQLVAYKDGYTDFDAGLLKDAGWNDLAAGLKWAPIQDHAKQFYLSVGAGYEFPVGDADVLQNDGELRVWAAVNKGFGPLHLGGTVNYFYPTSRSDEPLGYSETLSWHFHLDYYVCEWFSPVVEVNGYHVLNKHGEVVPFSGIDVTNLGGGDDVISLGLGAEIRPAKNLGLRAAWETPLTSGDDLYGWRITVSAVFEL